MFRVTNTMYAAARATDDEYARLQTMRSINEICTYSYVSDLMAVRATRDLTLDMPGTADAVIYNESIKAMQDALADDPSTPDGRLLWKVQDASVILGGTTIVGSVTKPEMIKMVSERPHEFSLRLDHELTLDFDDPSTHLGIQWSRIAIAPVTVIASLKIKSETVVSKLEITGLFLSLVKEEDTNTVTITISDEGVVDGSGVHIYRAYEG